jgi:hypothetical protein
MYQNKENNESALHSNINSSITNRVDGSLTPIALTPSHDQQIINILKGECPHNNGWRFVSYGHNSSWYKCVLCGKLTDW